MLTLPPLLQNVIFKQLQTGSRVSIWLYDNTEQRIEGKIIVSSSCPAQLQQDDDDRNERTAVRRTYDMELTPAQPLSSLPPAPACLPHLNRDLTSS